MENYYFKGQSTDLIKDHFLYFIGNAKHIYSLCNSIIYARS